MISVGILVNVTNIVAEFYLPTNADQTAMEFYAVVTQIVETAVVEMMSVEIVIKRSYHRKYFCRRRGLSHNNCCYFCLLLWLLSKSTKNGRCWAMGTPSQPILCCCIFSVYLNRL